MRFILLITFLYTPFIWSQGDLHFSQHYTQKDGLSNTTVQLIFEDSRGFLWIGTREGLNRFDGLHFKTFFHNKHSANSLPHNTVLDILEYQPGLLLLATPNGLTVFNSLIGKFEPERIGHAFFTENFSSQFISLFQDKEGKVWVNHSGQIDVLDPQLNYLYRLTDLDWAKAIRGSIIYYEDWIMDSKGNFWLPTDTSGIQIIDFKNKTVYNTHHNPQHLPYLQFKFIRALALDEKNQTLWVGPWGDGLYKYDLSEGTMMHQDFGSLQHTENSSINEIHIADNGNILCSTVGIFFEIDPITMQYHKIEILPQANASNSDPLIYASSIKKAKNQGYWVGANEGLFKLETGIQERSISLVHSTGGSQCVDLMVASNGNFYSLYDNGVLLETDRDRFSYSSYLVPIGDFSLTQMCEDKQHRLWIGSTNGILIFDLTTKKFKKPPFTGPKFIPPHINALFCDSDGDIWFGTREPFQLFRYKIAEDHLEVIENEVLDQINKAGSGGRISSIVEDHKEYLWMRSVVGGGILRYDQKKNEWKQFPTGEENLLFLSKKGVTTLYPDRDGNLWLTTTTGDGLIRYHYESNELEQFNREEGILSDYILHICPEGDTLWLTTQYGYSVFNMHDHSVISHDWKDISGLFAAIVDTFRHELVIAATGKQVFISTHERKNKLPPPVPIIDEVYVNHQEQFIDPDKANLRLKYDQKNVTIHFTTAYYDDAAKLRFAYFLEGADQEWQYPRGTRTAQYAALSSGNYVFKIKVSDPSGHWGDSVDAFSFTIVPPFWKASWFLSSLVILIATIIIWIVRKRVATVRYESGLKQKIAESEMMALRAQMNPHFIFNCINSIDSLIQSNDKYLATVYLNKFAKLIRNVLESSKQNTVPLTKDLETLQLYIELERFRNEDKFTAEINADPSLLQDDYKVPPLIIQPYVENAILHELRNRPDEAGHLFISLTKMDGMIQYVIEDNGIGRKNAINGHNHDTSSYGMQISSDRVKLFNQEEIASIEISDLEENGIPCGTRVNVNLKII